MQAIFPICLLIYYAHKNLFVDLVHAEHFIEYVYLNSLQKKTFQRDCAFTLIAL
jgi:hypothetical protein